MIKSHKEKQTNEVEVVDNIICNCCGNPIKHGKEIHEECPDDIYMEYIPIAHIFGYFSDKFEDEETHNFEVCEKCYADWIRTFKISPVI